MTAALALVVSCTFAGHLSPFLYLPHDRWFYPREVYAEQEQGRAAGLPGRTNHPIDEPSPITQHKGGTT